MAHKATDQVTTIGIDSGMNRRHLIGLDAARRGAAAQGVAPSAGLANKRARIARSVLAGERHYEAKCAMGSNDPFWLPADIGRGGRSPTTAPPT